MKTRLFRILSMMLILMIVVSVMVPVFASAEEIVVPEDETVAAAEEEAEDNGVSMKAIAAGVCVGIAAACGALGMAIAIAKTNEGIARQPEAEGKLRTSLMLGLVFIETAIIYALIVAILIIFVL